VHGENKKNMKTELIGINYVDNGVVMEVYVTSGGLRYGFWDVRDNPYDEDDVEEPTLYKSPEMVIGLLKERGYNPHNKSLKEMALLLTYAKVRDTMEIPMDAAMDLVGR